MLAGGASVEIPIYFLEAYAIGLAWRLALIWNPPLAISLKALADEAYNDAISQNVETANTYIVPTLNGYFR